MQECLKVVCSTTELAGLMVKAFYVETIAAQSIPACSEGSEGTPRRKESLKRVKKAFETTRKDPEMG